MIRKIAKPSWHISCIVIVLIIAIAGFFGFNRLNRNFHVVIPGKIYRSAQPHHGALFIDLHHYGIKAIINMRGKTPNALWFQQETAFAKHHHIHLYNINIPAHALPSVSELRKLVSVQRQAPQPYLIHCLAGVNRTGLAAAIAIILSGDPSVDDWQDQLSWQYNLLSKTSVGYQVMENYMHWLKANHLTESKAHFLKWVSQVKKLTPYSGRFYT